MDMVELRKVLVFGVRQEVREQPQEHGSDDDNCEDVHMSAMSMSMSLHY